MMSHTPQQAKASNPLQQSEGLEAGTALYGLLGFPLGHSFSRAFHNKRFADEGINAEYVNFELPDIEELPALIEAHPNLRGLNVTIPYKQAVIPFLDEMSDEAQAIGAVNVIRITRPDGTGRPVLKGFNSDVIGFVNSIRPLLKPHHKRALVLGTGGASKAVCYGLEQLGIEWHYVSRTPRPGILTYSALTPSAIADYTVIVNCTPLGMYPRVDSSPEIPYAALSSRHLLYDVVYNPDITQFMRQGRRFGATVKNGLEMLHLQALASWDFWSSSD